jgi:Xaa-Pro aminopeptidase
MMECRFYPVRRSALSLVLMVGLIILRPTTSRAQDGSLAGRIPVERLEARRQALLKRIGSGIAILRSAEEKDIERDYPQDSDFRQDNDFFYLTGAEAQAAWLVLVVHDTAPGQAILYLPARDSAAERWTGPKLNPGPEAMALTGITDIRESSKAEEEIRGMVRASARLFIKLDDRARQSDFTASLVFSPDPGKVEDLRPHLAALRVVKDDDELRRMRRSIDITADAQKAAMRAAVPGMWEYQIEAIVESTFRTGGAERVGFPSIVGSGPNSTTLHYDKNRRQTADGDVVVTDIGAEYGYYSADVTRTWPVSGKFTPRQRVLYDLVLATQQAGIDSVRPGMTVGRLNRIARSYMREHSGNLCGEKTCDMFWPHGLSHWLGMDVHDVGDYRQGFTPGMVVTVEPGIYIPAENIGIRIEDDVLVTVDGHEVLSSKAPRDPAKIEGLMAEGAKARGSTPKR